MKTKNEKIAEVPRRLAIGVVVICAALVAINLVAWLFFRNEAVAQRKMEAMARDYYENYLYDKWTGDALEKHAGTGFPEVTLRVLLTFEEGKYLGDEAIFEKVACNAIETGVKFYPEEPYGRQDYRMEINYSCNF